MLQTKNGFEITGSLGELTVLIMTHKVLYSLLKKTLQERKGPGISGALPSPHPRMCPSQHACCSSISCVWSPAHRRFPDGNRRTNQRAAFSCRTKTKQFTSRCQQAFHATLANNQDRNREKTTFFFSPVTKGKRRPYFHNKDSDIRCRERWQKEKLYKKKCNPPSSIAELKRRHSFQCNCVLENTQTTTSSVPS